MRGARESATANNIMVVIKLLAIGLFILVGVSNLHTANYTPFAPNGFTGIHQGAAIVFFAYIGFDAISTAAVYFGALTYIGNGPNFMVKAIAENSGVRMPSFFGYMAYSCAILVPSFVVVTFLFFR